MAIMFEIKDGVTKIVYNVRVVFAEDRYGVNDSCVNGAEPLVEFFDSRYKIGDKRQKELGQFASRYYLSTILRSDNDGLCLHGDVKDWHLCSRTFREVRQKLQDIAKVFEV